MISSEIPRELAEGTMVYGKSARVSEQIHAIPFVVNSSIVERGVSA